MTVHLRYYQRSDSTLFLFLSIVTAGLDFKADVAGGNLIQYGIVLVISLGSIFYLSQSTGSWPLKSTICLLASLTALIIPLTVAIYRDTSVGDYLRVSLPYLLCVLGTALGISATINGSASVLLKGLFVGSIISTLLTFINGTIELGFDFSTARYQIISPILPLGFALAIVDMRADNGRRHLVSLYLIFSVVLTFLSVTRSTMLELLAIFLIYILFEISYRNTRRFKFGYISSGRRGVPLLIIGAVAAVTGARLLGPSTYERWLARIFSSQEVGFDVTSATRMAEIDSQLQFLGESFSNLFLELALEPNTIGLAVGFLNWQQLAVKTL